MIKKASPKSAKRDHIDPLVYVTMLSALTKAMKEVPKLTADKQLWDIEGDWLNTGTVHFVDQSYQPLFADFLNFQCKTIKLTNYGKPAARISFFSKHRFWVVKAATLSDEEKKLIIWENLSELEVVLAKTDESMADKSGIELIELTRKLNTLKEQKEEWLQILHDADQFELAISNYDRNYYYTTMNLKYLISDEEEYQNMDVHLLNHKKDNLGSIIQPKYNIVFVDQQEIQRDHPHQHKTIDKYLNLFPIQLRGKKHTTYARPKAINTALEQFQPKVSELVAEPEIVAQKPQKRAKKKPEPPANTINWWEQDVIDWNS